MMFDEVISEIKVIKNCFGYNESEAIAWIKCNIREYGSEFKCDLNRYENDDKIAKEFAVVYN